MSPFLSNILIFHKFLLCMLIYQKSLLKFLSEDSSGERGIRTPGTFRYDGFQDRCNRPLYHLSKFGRKTIAWFS